MVTWPLGRSAGPQVLSRGVGNGLLRPLPLSRKFPLHWADRPAFPGGGDCTSSASFARTSQNCNLLQLYDNRRFQGAHHCGASLASEPTARPGGTPALPPPRPSSGGRSGARNLPSSRPTSSSVVHVLASSSVVHNVLVRRAQHHHRARGARRRQRAFSVLPDAALRYIVSRTRTASRPISWSAPFSYGSPRHACRTTRRSIVARRNTPARRASSRFDRPRGALVVGCGAARRGATLARGAVLSTGVVSPPSPPRWGIQ